MVVALDESTVFIFIKLECIESVAGVALLVRLNVTYQVVSREALNQVQLEVLINQELLASFRLLEGVVIFRIAGFDSMFFQILDSLRLQVR